MSIIPGLHLDSVGLLLQGSINMFLGISSLLSGILALMRRKNHLAIALAAPSIFILVVPGIIGIILLIASEDEFGD